MIETLMNAAEELKQLGTPAALIDLQRMQRNIERMQARMNELGVAFRPHVKTTKCTEVVQAQIAAGAIGITVSTLREAEQFFAAGITDILYGVGIVPSKLAQALRLLQRGCKLKLVTDSADVASDIVSFAQKHGAVFEVLIEVDTDGHRSGIKPTGDDLIATGRILHEGGMVLCGVMTHAGSSYDLSSTEALQAMAEQERSGCVMAAERLRANGLPCAMVSVGSTPTALSALQLKGVTEVRAGVYVFFDLVMRNIGVCAFDDIALSVLTTVIGHQLEKGWAIVDAGWMAMSRDRGTQKQSHDFGYGQICTLDGTMLPGYIISSANQEHGILSRSAVFQETEVEALSIAQRFPVGTQLRVLPNHACATGAQFQEYHAVDAIGPLKTWPRFYGW